tara:strand:+ start:877 stop:1296 length:420 start_codon:yes stop_codon:yes gene_type:complete
MARDSFKPAAGIAVLRQIDDTWCVLCLKTHKGNLDLTKGIIDEGESAMETALRETQEEAGITEVTFPYGKEPVVSDACTMFVGVTSQDPEIKPNPHSGVMEHAGFIWLPLLEAINSTKIKNFLMPAVEYAYSLVYNDRS